MKLWNPYIKTTTMTYIYDIWRMNDSFQIGLKLEIIIQQLHVLSSPSMIHSNTLGFGVDSMGSEGGGVSKVKLVREIGGKSTAKGIV